MANDDHEPRADIAPTRIRNQLTHLELACRWTPEQAELIFEFLAELSNAFFLAHEHGLTERARREAIGTTLRDADEIDFDEDPIPF